MAGDALAALVRILAAVAVEEFFSETSTTEKKPMERMQKRKSDHTPPSGTKRTTSAS
jgi:hypothetical protein